MHSKKALVLSTGSLMGIYQVGVLKKLMLEDEIDYDIITGTSVGAINGSILCQAPYGKPKESYQLLEDIWLKKLTNRKMIYKRWFFGMISSIIHKPSLFNQQPLLDLIKKDLNVEAIKNSNRILKVGAVSLNTGKIHFAGPEDDNFLDFLAASASFPLAFFPIKINNELYTDGGLQTLCPFGRAIRLGADQIDIVLCYNPFIVDKWDDKSLLIPSQASRILDISFRKILKSDLEVARLKNQLAEYDSRYRKVKIRVFMPRQKLMFNTLNFDPKILNETFQKGYNDALEGSFEL